MARKYLAGEGPSDSAEVFSPGPGDSVKVTPLGNNQFKVDGVLSVVPISGTAVTHRGGGLEWKGSPPMKAGDDLYDSLVDIMGDADPSWTQSLED